MLSTIKPANDNSNANDVFYDTANTNAMAYTYDVL